MPSGAGIATLGDTTIAIDFVERRTRDAAGEQGPVLSIPSP